MLLSQLTHVHQLMYVVVGLSLGQMQQMQPSKVKRLGMPELVSRGS